MRHLIIAFSDQQVAHKLRQLLSARGLPVAGLCASGAQVLQQASLYEDGGVVVCPYRLIDMTAREIMHVLPDTFDMLVLVTSRQQGLLIEPGIYTLTQPFDGPMLLEACLQLLGTRQIHSVRMVSGGQPRAARQTANPPGAGQDRTPEERKIIEQAKYLLMNRRHFSEQEAHRYLQRRSMESGIRLVDMARRIISPD